MSVKLQATDEFHFNFKTVLRDLQSSITALETWCWHSGLTLNDDKCVYMVFRCPSSLLDVSLAIGSKVLKPVPEIKYLGV